MRWLRILLFFVALFVAADHGARLYAADRLEGTLRSALSLRQEPEVQIHGFPFIWGAARGKLDGVSITTSSLGARGIRFEHVHADLDDVSFSPSRILSGDPGDIRIAGGGGSARMSTGVLEDALSSVRLDVSLDDLAHVPVEGNALELGPTRIPLPVLTDGMRYRSARLTGGDVVLRFEFEPTTLSVAG